MEIDMNFIEQVLLWQLSIFQTMYVDSSVELPETLL